MATPRLISIAAFWKNDRPEGIGFTITDDAGDLDAILKDLQESWTLMWNEAQALDDLPRLVTDMRDQLRGIGQRRGHLTVKDMLLAIGNIWLLESRGHMVTDEYNGLSLAYVE